MKKFLKAFLLCILSVFCIALAACGSTGADGNASGGTSVGESSSIVNDSLNRKIVYEVDIDMEADDIASVKSALNAKCTELDGYVENSSEKYEDGECTYVYAVYRVPTEKLDEFVSTVEMNGGISSKRISTRDITTSYVNATAKKTALENRKALLENMLQSTSLSTSEYMNIIDEISDVEAEIQSIELLITQYDSMVDYSTVYVTIGETTETPDFTVPIIIFLAIVAIGVFSAIFFPLYFSKRKKNQQQ